MNSRKPTKAESIFINAAINACGCQACGKMDHPNDYLAEQLAIHHNPDKGSRDKYSHFFAVPLCAIHHQGAVPAGLKLPKGEPVRHSSLKSSERSFKELIGDDLTMSYYIWERLSLDALDAIGELTGIYSFQDLAQLDGQMRNERQFLNK